MGRLNYLKTEKSESTFLSNAPRFAKERCFLEGPHASPVDHSSKSNMHMKMRMEHRLEKSGYSNRTPVIFSSKYKHPSPKVSYTRRQIHSYILYSCILQIGFNTDVFRLMALTIINRVRKVSARTGMILRQH